MRPRSEQSCSTQALCVPPPPSPLPFRPSLTPQVDIDSADDGGSPGQSGTLSRLPFSAGVPMRAFFLKDPNKRTSFVGLARDARSVRAVGAAVAPTAL